MDLVSDRVAGVVPRVKVGFGKTVSLAGTLTDSTGAPLANTELSVSRKFRGGFPGEVLAPVTTDAAGKFSYLLPAGPSALVEFAFAGTDDIDPTTAQVQTLVNAKVTLVAKKARIKPRAKIYRLTGVLAGKPLPTHGKTVLIQVLHGKTWHTIKHLRSNARGVYTTRYKIRRGNHATRLTVRTVVPRDATYPYQKGTSLTRLLRTPPRRHQ